MSHAHELIFHWRAEFNDGTVLKQFDEDGKEHSFQEVQDNEDALKYFYLELQNSPETLIVGVDLTNGLFNINDFELVPLKDDLDWDAYKPQYRIVNFRRVKHTFAPRSGAQTRETEYFIGWQVTHEGENYKKLLRVTEDGRFGLS